MIDVEHVFTEHSILRSIFHISFRLSMSSVGATYFCTESLLKVKGQPL
jgi:hypothetical protein